MAVQRKDLKDARARVIMQKKVLEGKNNAQVAKDLGISAKTVERALTYARRAELTALNEDTLLQSVLPAAIEAVLHSLQQDHDVAVALEVIKGMGMMLRPQEKAIAASLQPASGGGESLEQYLAKLRLGEPDEPSGLPPGDAIDATYVDPTRVATALLGPARETPAEASPGEAPGGEIAEGIA